MTAPSLISIRIPGEMQSELDELASARGETRSLVIKRLLEEGLRMERHPGVVFRPGAGGRRAGLAGGPDIWEIVRVLKNADGRGDDAILEAARWLSLSPAQVRVAARYYAAYAEEIDAWLARLDRLADEEAALLDRQRGLLA